MLKHIYIHKFSYLLFLISAITSFVLFCWTLFYGQFFSDDFTWLWHGQRIGFDLVKMFTWRMASFYSLTLNVFWAIFYNLFGYTTWIYFLAGIIIHGINSFLAGYIILLLTKNKKLALISSLFIAIAGTAYEPLVFVGANLHSFAVLLILSALVFYIKFYKPNKCLSAILCLSFFILALVTKEVAIISGILILGLFVILYWQNREVVITLKHKILLVLLMLINGAYGLIQFLWQRQGLAITDGSWQLGLKPLVRIPLIIFDMIIPLKYFLSNQTSILFLIISTSILIIGIFYLRKIKLFWYGLFWIVITTLPTIFFITTHWWDVSSSRYTYIARVGLIFIIGALYLKINKNLRLKQVFTILLVILLICQTVFWIITVQKEYPYVYNSGRTLIKTVKQIDSNNIDQVYVAEERPFANNPAHIVAAFETLSDIKEEQIIFLEKDQEYELSENQILLYWNEELQTYQIK